MNSDLHDDGDDSPIQGKCLTYLSGLKDSNSPKQPILPSGSIIELL